ncbi:MAG: peptide-methionine (S)-S-oxide reductase MsrA [Bacteroidetes bacterium]|nr:peptide-methionine (S)-S-oxide reductase MsrA [Bacteroidota bacterium]MBU1579778.1 peptide-methionine (S)-S-oxide reductase MsrA [Bacteroidota bacterium]MBU2556610.1 peptide-methionine (S)-S-oxide reductase MsrA [Bacteroidota bacterium]
MSYRQLLSGILILLNTTLTMNLSAQNRESETITLGAGCFWCTEAVFDQLKGIESITSGYSGGKIANPTYREVTSGLTGHAEVVQIEYNPKIVSLDQILEVFFRTHNPTTLNRQGADVGTQYRSVIFYHTDEQKKIAEEVKSRLNELQIWENEIVTEITAFEKFYKAEDYHQNYYEKNPAQGYCQFVIVPKLEKFNQLFQDLRKTE